MKLPMYSIDHKLFQTSLTLGTFLLISRKTMSPINLTVFTLDAIKKIQIQIQVKLAPLAGVTKNQLGNASVDQGKQCL